MTDSDDSTPTPPQTPSAMHRLGLVACPKCKASGLDAGTGEPLSRLPCDLCGGGRYIAVDAAIAWTLAHGDTDPPPEQ